MSPQASMFALQKRVIRHPDRGADNYYSSQLKRIVRYTINHTKRRILHMYLFNCKRYDQKCQCIVKLQELRTE